MDECGIATVPHTENVQPLPESNLVQEQSTFDVINDIPVHHLRGRQEYQREYADIACRLTAAHFNEQDVAYALGVSLVTIHSWKHKHPAFKAACEDGRREAKKRLVAAAMKQALGYPYIERNIKTVMDSDGTVLKSETSEFQKIHPGNEKLLLFLLMNMDRQLKENEFESVNKVEVHESDSVKIVIDGKSAKEQIARLAGELNATLPEEIK